MSLVKLQQEVDTLRDDVDALKKIKNLTNRATADDTEYVPVAVGDLEFKMLASTFFANKHQELTDNFDLAMVHQNSTITLRATGKTLTIPSGLNWKIGSECWVLVYGAAFTIDYSAITENIPVALSHIDKTVYRIQKTATDEFSISQVVNSVKVTADTSTIISLKYILGNLCNMASANATTTYTIVDAVTGGNARILINAASEPSITGATKIAGSTFVISTNMYLVVFNNGNVKQFWFEEI